MEAWRRCLLLVIYKGLSAKSSLSTCRYYSKDLPLPLDSHAASYSAVANSMFIMGGYVSGEADQRAVYKWDLGPDASPEWFTPIGVIPDSEWQSNGVQTMFPIDDILYVIGVGEATHTVNRFDAVSNQWLLPGDPPRKATTGGCVANNGSHFVMFDGWVKDTAAGAQLVYIQFYDIARDAWTLHAVAAPFDTTGLSFLRWRYQCCGFANDKLYIFGGKAGTSSTNDDWILDGMWRYDTLTQQFTSIGTLPRPCAYGTTALDGVGHMYLIGCYSQSMGYTNQILVFDASTESMASDIISSQTVVNVPAVVVFNRTLWIFGGWIDTVEEDSAKVQVCDISSLVPAAKEPTSAPTPESTEPSGTPSALPFNSDHTERDLLVSIVLVLAALGCFCVALLFYLRSRNKCSEEEDAQLPQNAIAPEQAQPISMAMPQPPAAAIVYQPVYQMQPSLNVFPPLPPEPRAFLSTEVTHIHLNPRNAGKEKFVYNPNRNYRKEGGAASIITSRFITADDDYEDDDDGVDDTDTTRTPQQS